MDGMYTISEMASIFGVSRQTLIYYDKIGLFAPAEVNEKGYRFYSPTQIPLMRLICMLRDLGVDLDEITRLTSSYDVAEMANKLRERVSELDGQIAALEKERNSVQERLSFYSDVSYWKARQGVPILKAFPDRYVIVEPFPGDATIDRSLLHPTLMRAVGRLRETTGARPMRGWGTMLHAPIFIPTILFWAQAPLLWFPRAQRPRNSVKHSAYLGVSTCALADGACRTIPQAFVRRYRTWTRTILRRWATLMTFAIWMRRRITKSTKRTFAAFRFPLPCRRQHVHPVLRLILWLCERAEVRVHP